MMTRALIPAAAVTALLAAAPAAFAGADPIEVGGLTQNADVVLLDTDEPLLAQDVNGTRDVYLRNAAGLQLLTDGASAGDAHAVALSVDGTRAIFETDQQLTGADGDTRTDVYAWHDGAPQLLSSANGAFDALADAVSPDATRVAFSTAEGIDPADANDAADVYLAAGGTITRVSVRSGSSAPAAFQDATPDLHAIVWSTTQSLTAQDSDASADIYLRDLDAAGTASALLSDNNAVDAAKDASNARISDDGQFVHFLTAESLLAADTDTARDVYRRQVGGALTLRSDDNVAADANTDAALVAVSGDGTRTLWSTTEAITGSAGLDGDTGRDLFEFAGAVPAQLSTGPSLSGSNGTATISAFPVTNGAIFSTTEGLVAQDTDGLMDVYLRTGATTTLLSPGGNAAVSLIDVAADGGSVLATTTGRLSADDTDDLADAYLLVAGQAPKLLSLGTTDTVDVAAVTSDLGHVLFLTATALSADDTDTAPDLYDVQPATGAVRLRSLAPAAAAPAPTPGGGQAPTPTTPVAPIAQPLASAPRVAVGGTLTRKGSTLRLTISCPAGLRPCAGSVRLRSAKKLVRDSRGRRVKTLALGSRTFRIAAGKRGVVTVAVPKAARSRLAAALRGGVVAVATTSGSGLRATTVTKHMRRG